MNSNSFNVSYFEFTLFTDYGSLNYLFFCLCLLVFMTIISANTIIVLTVCLQKSLHQPMYMFICSLCLNSVYGSVGFFPRFLMDLLSDSHLISHLFCYIQLYIIHTYKAHELNILTVMAYDRFVAICQPLHYHSRMTFRTVISLLSAAVIYSVLVLICFFYLVITLPSCSNNLNRIFCTGWSVVQLSCVDISVIVKVGQFMSVTTIFVPMFFVLYSYLRILLVCRRSSSDLRGKALQTCLPHIVTFVNYCISVFIEVSLSLNGVNGLNPLVSVVLSLEFLIIPPINNPLVYGLSLPQIRGALLTFLRVQYIYCP